MSTTSRKVGLSSITARQWLILLTLQLSSLLFGMTITLANVVLPQIRGALSATHDEIAWSHADRVLSMRDGRLTEGPPE